MTHPKLKGKTLTEQRNAAVEIIESLETEKKQLKADAEKLKAERDEAKATASRFAKRLNETNSKTASTPAPATPAKSTAPAPAKPATNKREFSCHAEMLAARPEGSLTGLERSIAANWKKQNAR